MANKRNKRHNDQQQGQNLFMEPRDKSAVSEEKPVGLKGTAVGRMSPSPGQTSLTDSQFSETSPSSLESSDDMGLPHVPQTISFEQDETTSELREKSFSEVNLDQSEPPTFRGKSKEQDEATSGLREESCGDVFHSQNEPQPFRGRTLGQDETTSALSENPLGEVNLSQSEPPAFQQRNLERNESTTEFKRDSVVEDSQVQDETPTFPHRRLNSDEPTSELRQKRIDLETSQHEQPDEKLRENTIYDDRVGKSSLWEYIFTLPIQMVNGVLSQFGLNWDDYERESKKRYDYPQYQGGGDRTRSTGGEQEGRQSWEHSEHDRREIERREKILRDKERKEKKRREKERVEFERREKERREKERKEQERREQELISFKNFENKIFELSEDLPSEDNLHFCLYSEKKQGKGEDSKPLIFKSKHSAHVGVFDGMGGAGSTEYQTYTVGLKSGAFLASRAIRACCLHYLCEARTIASPEHLTKKITVFLNELTRLWNIRPSGLRSSVIRVLPTTLAIVEATQIGSGYFVRSYWAGDSRNYILTSRGVQQISIDDLRQQKDPLQNLRSDDALSNCVCQDKQFVINVRNCGKFDEPIIILSATDGCFGYLPTPMHFEFILLDAMMKAVNCYEWCNNIKCALGPISGDDFSIGMQILGGDFNSFKESLAERYRYLKTEVIDPINQMKTAHENAIRKCEETKEQLHAGITELWEQYKLNYMSDTQSH